METRRRWRWRLRSPSWSVASTCSRGCCTRKTSSASCPCLVCPRSATRCCTTRSVRRDRRSDSCPACPICNSRRPSVWAQCHTQVVVHAALVSSTSLVRLVRPGSMRSSRRCTARGSTGVFRSLRVPCTTLPRTHWRRCGTPGHIGTACLARLTAVPPP